MTEPTPDLTPEGRLTTLESKITQLGEDVKTLQDQPVAAPVWQRGVLVGLVMIALAISLVGSVQSHRNADDIEVIRTGGTCGMAVLLINPDPTSPTPRDEVHAGSFAPDCPGVSDAISMRDRILAREAELRRTLEGG